jgi:hypothetical protein
VGEVVLAEGSVWVAVDRTVRQQVLVLYLASSALDGRVVAWSFYDGASGERRETGDEDEPPYRGGLDALKDGWRLLSMTAMVAPPRGLEYSTDHHHFECVFERLVVLRQSSEEGS